MNTEGISPMVLSWIPQSILPAIYPKKSPEMASKINSKKDSYIFFFQP